MNSASPVTTRLPPTNTIRDQLKLAPATVELRLLGRDLPEASKFAPLLMVPAATALLTSVRSNLAKVTAPWMLSWPAPCCNRLAPAIGCAVYCKRALIMGGVRPGLACSSSAAVPATTGAATDVPDRYICVSP